jgi:hypothetical protein
MRGAFSAEDLKSAVATGLLDEAQAARILAHAAARAGQRASLPQEDEPFELFKGFAEIFVSVGLVLLISGLLAFTSLVGGFLTPAIAAAICWVFARYFTLRRRMNLPSIVLVIGYAAGVAVSVTMLLDAAPFSEGALGPTLLLGGIVMIALMVWFKVFKLPFTMFLAGLTGLGMVLLATSSVIPNAGTDGGWQSSFDLRQGSGLAIGTFAFGLLALAAGMIFDMRDPFRLGRWSASGFWLHILAAPALVNTVALTAYNIGGTAGNLLLGLALLIFAALALIIDRRSFLTAGIGYLGVLLAWALSSDGDQFSFASLMLILGAILTGMGTWWTQLRAAVMHALPAFPGKNRLPPYVELT